ncbi:Aste57867_15093 [Aphanomyces stellatus]|uniref:Aste57867_15093 protein n=1 Tax=Aphanomyces stellatus TaxID=120398 RepID=A0A485L2X6_9STRA|nr:hypothetical protein As57867_015037 [Aphanomyces stellatus]VFT91906.1 Aste57867_15093 [Aphanomyces stellatus]
MSAKPRSIQKYEAMYKALGYHTFVLLASPMDNFRPTASIQKHSIQPFHTFLASLDRTTNLELVVHLMSNGGCRSWFAFQKHLVKTTTPFTISAIVIDSAPYQPGDLRAAPAAFVATITNPIVKAVVRAVVASVLQTICWVCAAIDQPLFTDMNFDMVTKQDTAVPRLFLYSKHDPIMPASHVELAIATAKAANVHVTAVDFEDSAHVAHFAKYPDLYVQAVKAFLSTPQMKSSL